MAQAAPAISAELSAKIREFTKKNFDHFEANVTQEQRDLATTDLAKFKAEPEWVQARVAEMNGDFAEADADGNGRLDAAESRVFLTKVYERGAARGNFSLIWDGYYEQAYEIYNAIDSSADGYNMADFMTLAGATVGFWEEFKAAKEAAQ
mmetsp:Transcript_918/g.1260  ORF Transcript_918/g.1260 Transcript_918/m.1260 type:complete len:150 (-) Transcript_918:90-539(-)|eukprot:CAMPEP_0185567060 /NCGR_PEP_ID=MMETSP0434-20130131/443_1 /TAXON_ID=626734 ORGANISM="Favella taraikaensis, Strain Fe Narragansett Bay" /NCGR_SAMPLE_ID=MMETSP0434 /ASSEMBLY_ACC=CAM_ASM_000379 /LENGTH=149 /DNA_ID=CAMNT_0028181189 /DNA_START=16 /DNA_END=465 /DNA_ORIENTATION=+